MPLYSDEGIVLRTAKLGEADRIITILTKDHGKVRAVAKGVRRTKSRFGARLEPFMHDSLLLATGRSLDVISQAAVIHPYTRPIAADYDAFIAASIIAETADKLVVDQHEPRAAQYNLLYGAMAALAHHSHEPWQISQSYVLRALRLEGWLPELSRCVVCERPLPIMRSDDFADPEPMYFSVPVGGLVCARDRSHGAHKISSAQVGLLAALARGDWNAIAAVSPKRDAAVAQLVEDWEQYYIERPLKSARLIDSQA